MVSCAASLESLAHELVEDYYYSLQASHLEEKMEEEYS